MATPPSRWSPSSGSAASRHRLGARHPKPQRPPLPPHSPPRRSVLFQGLRYKVDFLFRSFIFSWERFWAPRKNRRLSSPSCFILYLLRGLLRIPWPFSPRDKGDELEERALFFRSLSLASTAAVTLGRGDSWEKAPASHRPPMFVSAAACRRFVWHGCALSRARLRFFF